MKIGFGNDHTGTGLKHELTVYLRGKGHEIIDFGADGESKVDYPIPAKAVAEAVLKGEVDKGLLICGTGIGISIAANKIKGIRAALCAQSYSARMARKHNDANILCLGARVTGAELAKDIADAFFGEEFEGGRHKARLDIISSYEE